MSQPQWKCIANLGDVNPIEHGGKFVLVDQTGVYVEELWILEPENDDCPCDLSCDCECDEECDQECSCDPDSKCECKWQVSQILMERCTYINGVLSDNKYHPDHPAWFADKLQGVSTTCDVPLDELIECLCSEDPLKRAEAYINLVSYFGCYEFDQYPSEYSLVEIKKLVKERCTA